MFLKSRTDTPSVSQSCSIKLVLMLSAGLINLVLRFVITQWAGSSLPGVSKVQD